MAFKAELKFNDVKIVYSVVECDYECTQSVGENGFPNKSPQFGRINVTVETVSDQSMINWMMGTKNVRSGSIVFYKDDSGKAQLKTLKFEGAICVYFRESFTSYGESPMLTEISFVAKKYSLDGFSEDRFDWNGM